MNIIEVRNRATNAQPGSLLYELACAVCITRNIDPHGHSLTTQMSNWQAVIYETLLIDLLLGAATS